MIIRSDGLAFKRPVRACAKRTQGQAKSSYVPPRSAAPTPIVKNDVFYEVEKVIDIKMGKYGKQYFVKWEGYPESDNSWISTLPPYFDEKSPFYKTHVYASDSDSVPDSGSESEWGVVSDCDSESDSESDSGSVSAFEVCSDDEDYVVEDVVEDAMSDSDYQHTCKCKKPHKKRFLVEDDSDVDDDAMEGGNSSGKSACTGSKNAKKMCFKKSGITSEECIQQTDLSSDTGAGDIPSKRERMVMKALLALSAVVAEGFGGGEDEDDDE